MSLRLISSGCNGPRYFALGLSREEEGVPPVAVESAEHRKPDWHARLRLRTKPVYTGLAHDDKMKILTLDSHENLPSQTRVLPC
jgi:hypothetical protein